MIKNKDESKNSKRYKEQKETFGNNRKKIRDRRETRALEIRLLRMTCGTNTSS